MLTENKASYSESQNACNNLEGEMASEDLKDRLLESFCKNNKLKIEFLNNKYYDQKADFKKKL